MTQANDRSVIQLNAAHNLNSLGGETYVATEHQTPALGSIVPHPRTLRKAREQVKQMVIDGLSAQRIRCYLHLWSLWWVRTSGSWQYQELLEWFLRACWDLIPATYAAGLLPRAMIKAADRFQAQVLPTSNSLATA